MSSDNLWFTLLLGEAALGIADRMRQIREYRKLSQETVASWFAVTKQAWGRKERGEIRGFSPDDFELYLKKTEIDARWLFGQMDGPIEDADLRVREREIHYDDLVSEVREMRQQLGDVAKDDPVAHRVAINQTLREHVQMIQFLDASVLERINTLVYGYLQGRKDNPAERGPEENAS